MNNQKRPSPSIKDVILTKRSAWKDLGYIFCGIATRFDVGTYARQYIKAEISPFRYRSSRNDNF